MELAIEMRARVIVCKHCGGELVQLPPENTVRTNGWAHKSVAIRPDWESPLEEPCRINPKTLNNARGTTFAEPLETPT